MSATPDVEAVRRPRLLVVEDEDAIREGLVEHLRERGYDVTEARDGEAALAAALGPAPDARPHLVLLDIQLPGIDGFEVLRRARAGGLAAPVICLTARGQEIDRVVGLELGADDYVVKPFFVRELEARIKAVLRRTGRAGPDDLAPDAGAAPPREAGEDPRFGEVRLDLGKRCAWKRGRLIELAPRELALLLALWERRGRAASRAELLDAVWGVDDDPTTRTVDTHVARLRKKLEDDPARPRHLVSVPRFGYRLDL